MIKLGNAVKGAKRGKYIKLRGDEPIRHTARAIEFSRWFSANYENEKRKAISMNIFDEDVFHETYENIYRDISLKNREVINFNSYFWRAYYTNRIAALKRETAHDGRTVLISANPGLENDIEVLDFNYALYEKIIEDLREKVFAYVRDNYDQEAYALFEMYVALYPDMSYSKLSALTGVTYFRVSETLKRIKRDINATFGLDKEQSLSVL